MMIKLHCKASCCFCCCQGNASCRLQTIYIPLHEYFYNMSCDQTDQTDQTDHTNQTNHDQPEKPITEPPKISLSNDEYARECQRLGLREKYVLKCRMYINLI